MSNTTPTKLLRFFAAFFLCMHFPVAGLFAQAGFYKVFPSGDYHSFQKVVAVTADEYLFITTSAIYKADGSGNIVWQTALKEGVYSSLESLTRDQEGNCWVSSIVFIDQNTSRKVLYKITGAGQIAKTTNFTSPDSFENIELAASSNNNFFMAYQNRTPDGDAFIHISLIDRNGNELWTKRVTDTIYNTYSIKEGPGGSVDIFYITKEKHQGWVTSVSATGVVSNLLINLPPDPLYADYTGDFCRAPGGGFIFSGASEKSPPAFSDALVYKTDAAGNIEWLKRTDIQRGDSYMKIAAVAGGYILAGTAGHEDWGDDVGDILLTRLDANGNQIWRKAFGGAKMDYPRALQVFNNTILFGGQSSYPGETTSVPVLCRTDINGNLPTSIPFQLQPSSKMKTIAVTGTSHPQTFVQAAVGEDRTVIAAGNFLDPVDDALYPFLVCSNLDGQQQWFRQLPGKAAELKLFKQVRDNEYIAVTERKDLFANIYSIYKLDKKGTVNWVIETRANGIKDVTGTRDGGYLITGTTDVSFVNFETLLLKLDAAGNVQWGKTIGDLRVWETGRRIIETPEQDFLIIGNKQTEFDLASALYVLKIDKSGNKLWSRSFADGITTDLGYDVALTADQHYLFVGSVGPYSSREKDVVMIKTDKHGNLIWKKKQDLHLIDEGFRLLNSKGGGYFVSGTTGEPKAGILEKFIYVMKTDEEGNRKWTDYYGTEGLQTMHPLLLPTPWGDTLLLGTTQIRYGQPSMFIVKLNDREADPVTDPEEEIVLYPNPAVSSSALLIKHPANGPLFITLHDQSGKTLRLMKREKNSFVFRENLALAGLAAGVYYVSVQFNGKTTVRKLLITGY